MEKASQKFGDHWVASGNNPVMRIPGVVVSGEYNYVMNPLHPDFRQIEYSETESVKFDGRLSA
jgi:RES domain-containing protein